MMENKFKCSYPSCKKEAFHRQALELINKEDSSVELPFCHYHHLIVMGGHFKAEIQITPAILPTKKEPKGTPKKTDFELVGPLKEVEIVEQVMGAREVMIKLHNVNKDLRKS